MKCNIKKAMAAQNVRQMVSTQGTVKRLWELSTLLALSREFGFGKTRLKRFADEMNGIYKGGVYKSIIAITDAPNELKEKAAKWLDENGFSRGLG